MKHYFAGGVAIVLSGVISAGSVIALVAVLLDDGPTPLRQVTSVAIIFAWLMAVFAMGLGAVLIDDRDAARHEERCRTIVDDGTELVRLASVGRHRAKAVKT